MIAASDLRYAMRLLYKKPAFTVLTTLVMASGIGISLFLFSMFNTILFKDLPFKDGGRLIEINSTRDGQFEWGGLDLHDYQEIRTSLDGVSEFSAYKNVSVNASGRDGARRYTAVVAEPNIFQITRTKPILGRTFLEAEAQEGAERVVVIGYDLWQNQYGGDPQVIDRSLRIDGVSHRIIGIMPSGYSFPDVAQMWIPVRQDADRLARGEGDKYWGLALREEGVSMDEINRQLAVIMRRVEEQYPETNSGMGAMVNTLQQRDMDRGMSVVYSMYLAAILILVLASINVGNLLFSRSIERGKETAIRVALGAPRSRLIGQMLWESAIICSFGGVIGLLVLAWALEVTQAVTATFFVDGPAFWWNFGVDGYTLTLFSVFVLGTILATGLLPAWRNSGADFNSVLRDGTRGALGKSTGRLNRFLVISEIFLSMGILIPAAAMVVGAYQATYTDYGADTNNILTAKIVMDEEGYGTPEKKTEFVETLQSRLQNSMGIGDVMISSVLPGEFSFRPAIALEGKEYSRAGESGYPRANYIVLTPGSLAKLGVELREGRYFDSGDDGLGKKSVIITESFASRHFPNESAIGKRLRIAESGSPENVWLTVVGVVEHTIQGSNTEIAPVPSVFRPFSQDPRNNITLAVEMKSEQSLVVNTLRGTMQSIDPDLPAFQVESYDEMVSRGSAPTRFISTIMLVFGVAALVLAGSGIYGVMSNTVNQRTQEIGVKRALGATQWRITREFLMSGLRQLLWGGVPGLLVGCGMAFGMARVLGVEIPALIAVAVTAVVLIGGIVMMATYLPTKAALRIGPGEALHDE